MRYSYPMLINTLTFRRISDVAVEAVNVLDGESYTLGIDVVRYVRRLDGHTHPYSIRTPLSRVEIDRTIGFFEKHGLLRHSDVMRLSAGTRLKTLLTFRRSLFLMVIAMMSNLLVMLLWLPSLAVGIIMLSRNLFDVEFHMEWAGYVFGLVCAVVLHELGHAFAGIAYGARVFEMGIMASYFVLPGAYVLLDESTVRSRLKRIQIDAAGVECNFFLGGVFLILASLFPFLGGFFINAAICNLLIGALNLIPAGGLDGMRVISELLGVEDIVQSAREIVLDSEIRREALRHGTGGVAAVLICYLIFVLQIIMPVILISNVLEVIACFM